MLEQFIAGKIQKPPLHSFSKKVTQIGFVSVVISVAVMLIAFCVLAGFKKNIKDRIFAMSGQLNVIKYSNSQSTEANPISTKSAIFTQAAKVSNVSSVIATAQKGGILKSKTDIQGVVLKGVGLPFEKKLISPLLKKGTFLNPNSAGIAYEVVISQSIANQLEVDTGQSIEVYFMQDPPRVRKLKIVGIYESHFEEFDAQLVWVDIKLIQKMNDWQPDQVGAFEIQLKDFEGLNSTKGELVKLMDHDMDIENVKAKYLPIFDWLSLLDSNLYLFVAILFFVAVFNLVSVLIVLIMERIPMIGLLQALGANDFSIQKIFLILGKNIVLKGIVWGNIIGLGICAVQYWSHLVPLNPANYFIDYVPISFNIFTILLVNMITLLLSMLVLVLPSFLIRKINPVKALTFKK